MVFQEEAYSMIEIVYRPRQIYNEERKTVLLAKVEGEYQVEG